MKFIVKLHSEITIKSAPVRRRFIQLLESNVRNVLRRIDEQATVRRSWTQLEVRLPDRDESHRQAIIDCLACIPGIQSFLEVQESTFTDVDDIFRQVLPVAAPQIAGKRFAVRVKRSGRHEFSSKDVERYVGGGLNQAVADARVGLVEPDVTIRLEIQDNRLYIIRARHKGVGGYPIATQEDTLSLISGGFDSSVASYMSICRGSRTHYLFFNLGGSAHEIGVKQVAYYLWNKFGASHKVRFISVDFAPVVAEILEKIDNGQMGVVLKRMMMRAGAMVARRFGIKGLVTGESLGQVSSQTLTNLNVIDRVTDMLILRPLIFMDKQTIIDIARQIGTEDFAKTMPEYCGVISKRPTVKAVLEKIEANEAAFNFTLLEQVVADAKVEDIRAIAEQTRAQVTDVSSVSAVGADEVVIDVRAELEQEEKPLQLPPQIPCLSIPFFRLASRFGELDSSKTYLLYCDRGVMSKLQALYLQEQGYTNVKVFQPEDRA